MTRNPWGNRRQSIFVNQGRTGIRFPPSGLHRSRGPRLCRQAAASIGDAVAGHLARQDRRRGLGGHARHPAQSRPCGDHRRARGSGKTALADVIAAGAMRSRPTRSSFVRAHIKFRIRDPRGRWSRKEPSRCPAIILPLLIDQRQRTRRQSPPCKQGGGHRDPDRSRDTISERGRYRHTLFHNVGRRTCVGFACGGRCLRRRLGIDATCHPTCAIQIVLMRTAIGVRADAGYAKCTDQTPITVASAVAGGCRDHKRRINRRRCTSERGRCHPLPSYTQLFF